MLVDLINHFGEIGGFKDILERISDSEFKPRVDTLLFYLKAIEQVSLPSIVGLILLNLFHQDSTMFQEYLLVYFCD